uniref:Uncharacterized protein n=1 Tax=Hemiselmis andersenii TaxID=464988 RepID=A0A6T8HJ76_HEMAN
MAEHRSLTASQKREAARVERICNALAEREGVPPWTKSLLVQLGPLLTTLLAFIDASTPVVMSAIAAAVAIWNTLPKQAITALYGLVLCFFGGHYTVTLAAVEAFRVSGGERVTQCIRDIWTDITNVRIANAADNKKDDDHDGKLDVDQLSSDKALLSRKIGLVLRTVDPDRVIQALGGLAQAFAGVLATLKVQFARTVALAVSISDNLRKPAGVLLTPVLAALIPPEYHHWVSPIISIACKVVGMWVAWLLARIIATCHASMIGGLMAARAAMGLANQMGWVKVTVEDSMLDEAAGWTLCVIGAYFQLSSGFSLPFPLNVVLLPVSMVEWFLTWAVTWFD